VRSKKRINAPKRAIVKPKGQPVKKNAGHQSEPASETLSEAPLSNSEELKHLDDEKEKLVEGQGAQTETKEIEFLELSEAELVNVKKEIYEQGFKHFEEFYQEQLIELSQLFDLENDTKDKTKTMRAIFKNVRSLMQNYIDFDSPEMPIPAKFDEKMVLVQDPH